MDDASRRQYLRRSLLVGAAMLGGCLAEETPTDPDRTHAAVAEAADASPSYVGTIVRDRSDLLADIAATAESG